VSSLFILFNGIDFITFIALAEFAFTAGSTIAFISNIMGKFKPEQIGVILLITGSIGYTLSSLIQFIISDNAVMTINLFDNIIITLAIVIRYYDIERNFK
jgi:hypothetical protein